MGIYNLPIMIRDAMFLEKEFNFIMYSNYHQYWYEPDDFSEFHKYNFNLIFNV